MLIGNYSVLNKSTGIRTGGVQESMNRSNFNQTNSMRGVYFGNDESGFNKTATLPLGYLSPYAWFLPQKAGSIASYTLLTGSATWTAPNIAGGLNGISTITGTGQITNANMGLIVSMVSTLTGTGQITNAQGAAILNMVASLTGTGSIDTPILGAIIGMVCDISGTGQVTGSTLTGKGWMTADVTPFTELSPQSLAASLWNALATSYNEAGTMGEKLNAAGTAGDPWTTNIPGSYVAGQAGYILGTNIDMKLSDIVAGSGGLTTEEHDQLMALLKKSQFLALK